MSVCFFVHSGSSNNCVLYYFSKLEQNVLPLFCSKLGSSLPKSSQWLYARSVLSVHKVDGPMCCLKLNHWERFFPRRCVSGPFPLMGVLCSPAKLCVFPSKWPIFEPLRLYQTLWLFNFLCLAGVQELNFLHSLILPLILGENISVMASGTICSRWWRSAQWGTSRLLCLLFCMFLKICDGLTKLDSQAHV